MNHYYVDGYNFLFKFFHSNENFEKQRELVIDFLHSKCLALNLNITLVFDAHRQNDEMHTMAYKDPIEIIYTPKNQTADDFILEKLSYDKRAHDIVVVSSDKQLLHKASLLGAQTQTINSFIASITKKEKHKEEKKSLQDKSDYADTDANINRLLKIFEKKFKEDL